MSKKIAEMVTNKIIEKLEQGTIPWRRPFQSAQAVNWNSQRPYRGINTLLLDAGEYATFNQIKKAGGKVKKGEKSQFVIFWKWIEIEDGEDEDGEIKTKKVPFMRYYNVFEINTQVEGLESKRKAIEYEHDPIEAAEKVVRGYQNAPEIRQHYGSAYYMPSKDLVSIPPMSDFIDVHEYYSTLFHELVHSTGHEKRLDRGGITDNNKFGSEDYSKEELVAEIGASFLNTHTGIIDKTIDNSASYIQSWLRVLRNDKRMIITASQQAQKAVDHILGTTYKD